MVEIHNACFIIQSNVQLLSCQIYFISRVQKLKIVFQKIEIG